MSSVCSVVFTVAALPLSKFWPQNGRIWASKWQNVATGPKKAIGRSERTSDSFSGLYKLFYSFSLLKDRVVFIS